MPSLKFAGFAEGRTRVVPIPEAFFRELLPSIRDPAELRVTLLAFDILSRKEAGFRYLRRQDFLGHPAWGEGETEALDRALRQAVDRGTLLGAQVDLDRGAEALYFLNTPRGRAAAQGVRAGEWTPSGDPAAPVELPAERPNIFQLYEDNLGPLTPILADELREAEQGAQEGNDAEPNDARITLASEVHDRL